MKILVIDDETSILDTLEPLLNVFGHEVVTAIDGQDGLNKFLESSDSINVVVTDIDMPNMNGVDFAKALTAKRYFVPIIFMTGNPHSPNLSNIPHIGVLKKPFKINKLISLLEQVKV